MVLMIESSGLACVALGSVFMDLMSLQEELGGWRVEELESWRVEELES